MTDEPKHTYPSQYAPGSGCKDLDEVWKMLDYFKPGIIPDFARSFIAGHVVAMIRSARKEGARAASDGPTYPDVEHH